MGKMKEKPRYTVFSFRTDDELAEIISEHAKGYHSSSEFLLEAVKEKMQLESAE